MDLLNTILNAQDGHAVDQLGAHVGLDRSQTVAAIQNLLPALAGGLSKNAAQPGGLESLMAALANGTHPQYVNDPSQLAQPAAIQAGNNPRVVEMQLLSFVSTKQQLALAKAA